MNRDLLENDIPAGGGQKMQSAGRPGAYFLQASTLKTRNPQNSAQARGESGRRPGNGQSQAERPCLGRSRLHWRRDSCWQPARGAATARASRMILELG